MQYVLWTLDKTRYTCCDVPNGYHNSVLNFCREEEGTLVPRVDPAKKGTLVQLVLLDMVASPVRKDEWALEPGALKVKRAGLETRDPKDLLEVLRKEGDLRRSRSYKGRQEPLEKRLASSTILLETIKMLVRIF